MEDYTIINDTFAILWGSVLFVEETEVFSENNKIRQKKRVTPVTVVMKLTI